MDRTERVGDLVAAARNAAREQRADMWTSMPAIVETYDSKKQIVSARPTIKGRFRDPQGKNQWITMPLCLDCPVHFTSGGGFTTTFPIKKGDEGLLIFASRCIDKWWKEGKIQEQADLRMHNLSDGFYIPGVRSQPRKLDNVSEETVQMRTDDGKNFVELASDHIKNIVDGASTLLTKDTFTVTCATIILDGFVKLGGADAALNVGMKNSLDTAGDKLVSALATRVVAK